MRTRICYPFILLIALLTTVSCENELPFSVKDNPPKLVMNALINADSLTNVLYLNFTGRGYGIAYLLPFGVGADVNFLITVR